MEQLLSHPLRCFASPDGRVFPGRGGRVYYKKMVMDYIHFDSIDENSFEGFVVGALSNGFFYGMGRFFLGCDISAFPSKKPKKSSGYRPLKKWSCNANRNLFSRIPELEDFILDGNEFTCKLAQFQSRQWSKIVVFSPHKTWTKRDLM